MRAAITFFAFIAAHIIYAPLAAAQTGEIIFSPGTGSNSGTYRPQDRIATPAPVETKPAPATATVRIAAGEDPVLQTGLLGPGRMALRAAIEACEAWIFDPATWATGIDHFTEKAKLTGRLERREGVPEFALPPVEWRRGNHYWYAKGRSGEGYYVTVSDLSPTCHIAGFSPHDLYADIMAEFDGTAFLSKWQLVSTVENGTIHTNNYSSGANQQFNMIASWANAAGGPTDRIQFIASMQFQIRK